MHLQPYSVIRITHVSPLTYGLLVHPSISEITPKYLSRLSIERFSKYHFAIVVQTILEYKKNKKLITDYRKLSF